MKKVSKILVIAFIVLALPILVACGGNTAGENDNPKPDIVPTTYTITFDLNSEDVRLNNPEKIGDENNYYSVTSDDECLIAYIDSHSVDVLSEIDKDTVVTISIYTSIFVEDIEIKLNNNDADYTATDVDDYKCFELTFTMESDVTIYVNGILGMIF